jgi:hypothetical protein
VIDGIDAYLYHAGDEFSKAFEFHLADPVHVQYTWQVIYSTLFMSLKLLSSKGTRKFSKLFTKRHKFTYDK